MLLLSAQTRNRFHCCNMLYNMLRLLMYELWDPGKKLQTKA